MVLDIYKKMVTLRIMDGQLYKAQRMVGQTHLARVIFQCIQICVKNAHAMYSYTCKMAVQSVTVGTIHYSLYLHSAVELV